MSYQLRRSPVRWRHSPGTRLVVVDQTSPLGAVAQTPERDRCTEVLAVDSLVEDSLDENNLGPDCNQAEEDNLRWGHSWEDIDCTDPTF